MHALVQLNPELGSVLNVSPPTEEEEAEADKFLSVLKKIPSDEDLMLREFDQVEGEDEVEVTTKKTTKKEATAKKKKTIRQEEEKGVQIKTKNTFFPHRCHTRICLRIFYWKRDSITRVAQDPK